MLDHGPLAGAWQLISSRCARKWLPSLSTSVSPESSASCAQPERLQELCDRFGPQMCSRPSTAGSQDPDTAHPLRPGRWLPVGASRQVEISRTLVFDDPRPARRFFEALVADKIGIARREQVAVAFARQVRKTTTRAE